MEQFGRRMWKHVHGELSRDNVYTPKKENMESGFPILIDNGVDFFFFFFFEFVGT